MSSENQSCEHKSGAVYGCQACFARVRARFPEFPLLRDRSVSAGPFAVPWVVAERAWQDYAKQYGTEQSVERIAERGGFYWAEMDTHFPGWREAVDEWKRLSVRVAVLEAEQARRLCEFDKTNEACRQAEVRAIALEQQVSDLETSLENARKERDEALLECERLRKSAEVARSVAHSRADERDAAEDELARLKPSGQVAEDETRLRHSLNARGAAPETHDALSRLSAKAQGYEAAVADNAALLILIFDVVGCIHTTNLDMGGAHRFSVRNGPAAVKAIGAALALSPANHSGAALLEEHRKALVRARNKAFEKAASGLWANEPPGRIAAIIRAMKEPES